jgi:hypothetical protein
MDHIISSAVVTALAGPPLSPPLADRSYIGVCPAGNSDAGGTPTQTGAYWIWSYSENIGMYIAMTMKPTIAPTTMIMIGSMIAVSDLTAAATWSS